MKTRVTIAALTLLLAATATPSLAVDCNVNVFTAHNTAKLRGWAFTCSLTPGIGGGFVTYPPPMSTVGCAFKTPPVVGLNTKLGSAFLFSKPGGSRPSLNNGWVVKSYEVSGGQWRSIDANDRVRVAFETMGTVQPNRTYNYSLSKLTLTHASGSCAKAIDEAF